MKKLLVLFAMMVLPMVASAQNNLSVVTLKNGTELKGVIKSIDPTDVLVLVISGVETTIKMSDVAKVEAAGETTPNVASLTDMSKRLDDEKLIVTDKADYPESFDLKVGNASIKMILVRGGDMNMGFNGRHSRSMKSEPVHKVGVTSFYMSETFVTTEIIAEVTGEKVKKNKKSYYSPRNWDRANEIIQKISLKCGMELRLPTEAEWEFAACSQNQELFFSNCNMAEYCFDWFGEFKDTEYRIDPVGPLKGPRRVVRAYGCPRGKLNRAYKDFYSLHNPFRLAIKAKDVKK